MTDPTEGNTLGPAVTRVVFYESGGESPGNANRSSAIPNYAGPSMVCVDANQSCYDELFKKRAGKMANVAGSREREARGRNHEGRGQTLFLYLFFYLISVV